MVVTMMLTAKPSSAITIVGPDTLVGAVVGDVVALEVADGSDDAGGNSLVE
jgi:hypothetical protein